MGCLSLHGLLARYTKAVHAPGMRGTFSPQPRLKDPDMYHGTCVAHVPWCMPGSLTSGFLSIRWQIKLSQLSRRMRNPQMYVSVKRPVNDHLICQEYTIVQYDETSQTCPNFTWHGPIPFQLPQLPPTLLCYIFEETSDRDISTTLVVCFLIIYFSMLSWV